MSCPDTDDRLIINIIQPAAATAAKALNHHLPYLDCNGVTLHINRPNMTTKILSGSYKFLKMNTFSLWHHLFWLIQLP
jgi:hypothetical protein